MIDPVNLQRRLAIARTEYVKTMHEIVQKTNELDDATQRRGRIEQMINALKVQIARLKVDG